MHLHIGCNTPGFLPENDTYCVSSADDAATCAMAEVMKLGEFVLDGCDEGNCRRCGWCRKGREILARWQEMQRDAKFPQEVGTGWSETFAVPCSPGQAVWVHVVASPRATCEDNADS